MALAHPLSVAVSPVLDISPLWVPEASWCLAKFAPFNSLGCWNDTGSDSALLMRSSADQGHMTIEECWAICKGTFGPEPMVVKTKGAYGLLTRAR